MKLENQVAVVTGGAQGIGAAAARRLAAEGARIVIWDLERALGEELCEDLGNGSEAMAVDIVRWDEVETAAGTTIERFGRIDIAVNSAGIAGPVATVEDFPVEEFDRVIEINLKGTFLVNKAVVPHMKAADYGRIVNIASIAGKEGNPNASAYSASKAGVIGLTKSLGKELADFNIAVNCVTPAAAKTRIFDQISEEHIEFMLSKIPRKRFLLVEEAASLIAWLSSPENSFSTAGVFDLSGGRATY